MKLITVQTKDIIRKSEKGFTLIELLVVIGILAILMGIVLIAINPAAQFAQANNTTRTNAVTQILNAVGQYSADNKGLLPPGIPVGASNAAGVEIADTTSVPGAADICSKIMPSYIPSLPTDPSLNTASVTSCATYRTDYKIWQDANGRVTVFAPGAEAVRGTTPTIQVTR